MSLNLHALLIWLHAMGIWLPIGLAVCGLALFVGCAFSCGNSPSKEKDRLFGPQVF